MPLLLSALIVPATRRTWPNACSTKLSTLHQDSDILRSVLPAYQNKIHTRKFPSMPGGSTSWASPVPNLPVT